MHSGKPFNCDAACALQIDGLIVNCSAFNPTPSLSAAVVNHFKFKQSIRTFNLSGMGCAASVIGVDLAMEILAVSAHSCSYSTPCAEPLGSSGAGLMDPHPQCRHRTRLYSLYNAIFCVLC